MIVWPRFRRYQFRQHPIGVDVEGRPRRFDWKECIGSLDIDHEVRAVRTKVGGSREARIRLDSFLRTKLGRYDVGRNDTDDGAASGLSPWIHFGHISPYEILYSILEREGWTPGDLDEESTGRGSRAGWWGLSPAPKHLSIS